MDLETMKQAVIDALEDIKGYDITVMDVRKLTSMASYMIVANASSTRQTKAMANNVRRNSKNWALMRVALKANVRANGYWST
jgi:ribosome-associated protein